MSIDVGLVIVIVAVLVFYLRLIILQRQRAKQLKQQSRLRAGKNPKETQGTENLSLTVISKNPLDRIIGAAGLVLVVFGLLLYAGFLPLTKIQPYWWIPTALGIIGFSWVFRL